MVTFAPLTSDVQQSDLPRVFIVIPVFNRAQFVGRCIRSVQNQTYINWNLMIVDDNSTDNSLKIIQGLAREDRRISWKTNSDYGHSAAGARQSGLVEADGDYIAFLDSDDVWPQYHLMEFVNFLEEFKAVDLVMGDLQRIKPNGTVVSASKFKNENGLPQALVKKSSGKFKLLGHDHFLDIALTERFTIGLHSSLFRKKVFDNLFLRDEILVGEDFVFTLEIIQAGLKIAACETVHLYYTVHDANISACNRDSDLEQKIKVNVNEITLYRDRIPQLIQLSSAQQQIIRKYIADIYVWRLANAIYRNAGQRLQAARCILKGIALFPFDFLFWKTLIGTLIRG